MSRSVSAPSSVTNTSPCWNGLIVPGSTLRYGSNFWSWTRSPRALSRRPSEAATIPFPRAETTPPVTKTYFGARALTVFQGSTPYGRTSAARPASACEGTLRPMPPKRGASTASVACVSPSSTGSRSRSTSACSLVSWNETCLRGTLSRTSRDPPSCGRRRKLARFVPSRRQCAPGARARRTLGAASTRPGHHSGQRAGSASTSQTSSTGAGSVRLASYRGKELPSAEHPLELGLPLVVAELLDPRVRPVARRLLDPKVAIRERGDLRKVRDGHDLSVLRESPEQRSDGMRRLAADPRVDLVEHERVAACDGRDGQRDPRELPAGGGLRDLDERQPRIRADEEDGLVASGRARLVPLPKLADELALSHADPAQF